MAQEWVWGAEERPIGAPQDSSMAGYSLYQAPRTTGVAASVQQGAGWAELVRVVVGRGRWGQRWLVDDLDRGALAPQGGGAAGVGG